MGLVKMEVRLTESTHVWVGREAGRRGLSVSAFVRTVLMREQERQAAASNGRAA